MLECVATRPRTAARLFDLVREQWGDACERRLWRVLRWLELQGHVQAVGVQLGSGGVRFASDGYVLARQEAMAA